MSAIIGASVIALAALIAVLSAAIIRRPGASALVRGEFVAMALSLLITAALSSGMALMAMEARSTALWQWFTAAAIVVAAMTLFVLGLRNLSQRWQDDTASAQVIVMPGEQAPVGPMPQGRGTGSQLAA